MLRATVRMERMERMEDGGRRLEDEGVGVTLGMRQKSSRQPLSEHDAAAAAPSIDPPHGRTDCLSPVRRIRLLWFSDGSSDG